MKKRLVKVLLAMFCAMMPVTCGFTGDSSRFGDAVLVMNNMAEVGTLDPAMQNGVEDQRITLALFEGLLAYDPETLRPVPGVAERHEISADGRVWTFHLRDCRWSNGDRVRADDFLYSWRRVLTAPSGDPRRHHEGQDYYVASGYSQLLEVIDGAAAWLAGDLQDFSRVGIEVVDEQTLVVRLARPTPWFPELLCFATFMPVHPATVETHRERWTRPENIVSNGPFVLAERRPGDSLRVERNPRYWDRDAVGLDAVVYLSTDQVDTALDQFLAKESDWVRLFNPKKARAWRRDPELSQYLKSPVYLGTYFYRFNLNRPPLDEARVRRALALAVDRAAITTHVTGMGELPAVGLIPPCIEDFVPWPRLEGRGLDFDPSRARDELAAAGFPGGRGFPELTLAFNTDIRNRAVAEAVQRMWKEHLGITVLLENREKRVHFAYEKAGDFDISRGSWIGDFSDPVTFLDVLRGDGGNNRTGFSDAAYDALLDEAARALDPERRLALLAQAEERLMVELAPILPLYYFTSAYVLRPGKFEGIYENGRDVHPPKAIRRVGS